jgi:alpha-methylacyl-CoA racemase
MNSFFLSIGSAYVSSWMWTSRDLPMVWFGNQRGQNLLDGGAHFYDTYETLDGLHMAVGALEPQFYSQLLLGLGLDSKDENHSQMNINEMKEKFEQIFKTKTQKEWTDIFNKLDACCTPVLNWDLAHEYEHNQQRKNFALTNQNKNTPAPVPAPRFSSSKLPSIDRPSPSSGEHTIEILHEIGYSTENVEQLIKKNIVQNAQQTKSKL